MDLYQDLCIHAYYGFSAWGTCWTPSNGSVGVSDSFACLWNLFSPFVLPCPSLILRYMPSLTTSCYVKFGWYHWSPAIFWRDMKEQLIWRKGNVGGGLGGEKKRKAAVQLMIICSYRTGDIPLFDSVTNITLAPKYCFYYFLYFINRCWIWEMLLSVQFQFHKKEGLSLNPHIIKWQAHVAIPTTPKLVEKGGSPELIGQTMQPI